MILILTAKYINSTIWVPLHIQLWQCEWFSGQYRMAIALWWLWITTTLYGSLLFYQTQFMSCIQSYTHGTVLHSHSYERLFIYTFFHFILFNIFFLNPKFLTLVSEKQKFTYKSNKDLDYLTCDIRRELMLYAQNTEDINKGISR